MACVGTSPWTLGLSLAILVTQNGPKVWPVFHFQMRSATQLLASSGPEVAFVYMMSHILLTGIDQGVVM